MNRKPKKITLDEIVQMFKDAKIIESALELGQDRNGALWHGQTFVADQVEYLLYPREQVCRAIGSIQMRNQGAFAED